MFLRSKIQEMILKRRSRSMNSAQQGHVSSLDQLASPSMIRYDNSGNSGSGGSSNGAALSSACPRLLHSSSLPTGSVVFGKNNNTAPDAESETTTAFSTSPVSVLDAAAASFASSGSDAVVVGKRRPWRAREGLHGLADALDCTDDEQQERSVVLAATSSPSLLVRSCSLDRRVEFGVKNKRSWLPLRETAAASPSEPGGETDVMIEPSSEDYTCVICRGPNPRTVHIFGDRVVEGGAESPPRPNNSRASRGDGTTFLSL